MNATGRAKVLLILGSVRAGRRCPQIGAWVGALAERTGRLACETVDLRDWPLPAEGEPGIPSAGIPYAREETRAWSAKVAGADGFLIVTPQYNWGYPAALKNALDHLYAEWGGKPLAIVTYGGHGGGKCAEQLRQVAAGLKMRPVATMPGITVPRALIEADAPQGAEDLEPYAPAVRQALAELADALAPAGG